ncbi:MAG: TonB-dependent receptor [Fodinibius sp.]|nr:TonB-dependent receptor [Fodinibius sp.]
MVVFSAKWLINKRVSRCRATVMLADASGGTSTSQGGTFALNKLVSGTYEIVFSYVGYRQVSKTVTIEPRQQLRQKVMLEPKAVDFAPVVVNGKPAPLSYRKEEGQSVAVDNNWRTMDEMRDPIQSLTLFSGVKYGLPMTDLHLQGGQASGHRIRLDGVPVYNPYSFGQMFSAFSPYAIDRIRLHKAGYGVDEGSQISGLIDMNHDISGVNGGSLTGQIDPLSVNLQGDLLVPLEQSGDDTNLKVMSAVRFNYWDLLKDPTLDRTLGRWNNLDPLIANLLIDSNASEFQPSEQKSNVAFYDWHLASRYNINTYETLTASMYVGKNSVNTDLLNRAPGQSPEYLYARDAYQWNNMMGQVSYNHLLSPRVDLNAQLSYSANSLSHRYIIGTSTNPQIPSLSNDSRDVFAQFQDAGSQNLVPNQRNDESNSACNCQNGCKL